MPLIKPRTRGKQILRHIGRLDRENIETLHAYAAFLGESTDYVLNQVIDTVLAKRQGVREVARRSRSLACPNTASRVGRNRATSVRHSASTVPPPPGSPVPLSVS